ncbi:uncharacterized protein [Argopecten irradians]|uniref:uncharacterized protein n=1 Tax=Argopecten irradians TaxID=31199 RepID=UPI00371E3D07
MAEDEDFERQWLKPTTKIVSDTSQSCDGPMGNKTTQKSVAIIGAGVSGLCAIKNLLAENGKIRPKAFERNSRIGGTWVYSEKTVDAFGLPEHSCLYQNLRSNNPKQLLTLRGFPHDQSGRSYIDHKAILKYVEDFSEYYGLGEYIQFNTLVKEVLPVNHDDNKVTWNVKYCTLKNPDDITTEEFDAVIVCNGHCYKTYTPDIPGMEHFHGTVIHSKDYRRPEPFSGRTVLVIGASASGLDIAMDIQNHAKQIILSHKAGARLKTIIPKNAIERPVVKHISKNENVIFVDETEAEVDCIVFCTGYLYDFPFLSSDIIQVQNQHVTPLYKHMVNINYTNLMFIGIPERVTYFLQIHEQARAAVAILDDPSILPSVEEMIKDADEEFHKYKEECNLTDRQVHCLGIDDRQWQYNEGLALLCGFQKLPTVLHNLATEVAGQRATNFLKFRRRNYRLHSDSFEIVYD